MEIKIYTDKEKIIQYLDYKNISKNKFYKETGLSNGFLDSGSSFSVENLRIILDKYRDIDQEWFLTGKGEMLKSEDTNESNRNLIPLYDVGTIGGANVVADMSAVSQPNGWIDAGDWFLGATAAIRHYGSSMKEYPSGCILALREINDKSILAWGQNYCIETEDLRITKRLQKGDDEKHVIAYSSNEDTYNDGRLINEPITIQRDSIRRLFLVLGCVVKEHTGNIVSIH